MTKTGYYEVLCRCPSQAIRYAAASFLLVLGLSSLAFVVVYFRDKWVVKLQRVLPQHKIAAELQMCCFMEPEL
jgi:hypothetical protein